MNKKFFAPVLGAIILGGVALGAHQVFAQTATPSPYSALAQKIATKFGLNIDQVQAVFTQDRQDRQALAETRYETFLTQAVTDGKITQTQQQLLLTKHKELIAARQDFRTMTVEERKQAMLQARADIDAWAKANGVDARYLFRGMGRGHFGFKGPGM